MPRIVNRPAEPLVTPPRASTARAEATAAAIVSTAERLFRDIGYQKTTVADIARELDMSPANVYRFYPSKSAINEAVGERLLGTVVASLWAVAHGREPAEDRLRAMFGQMQQQTIALFFAEKRMHDMVAAALEEHWTVIDGYLAEIERVLRHIIMDGQAEGVFARTDPEATARVVQATMVSFMHPRVIEECSTPDDLPAQTAALAEFVLRALRRNPKTDEC